jgi:hypothetical protein
VNIHRGSGICETQSYAFKTRDLARSDFPIWSREIIRGILWVLRTSDKGVEEQFSSLGRRKRRSCGSGRALGGAFASKNLILQKKIPPRKKEGMCTWLLQEHM